MPNNRNLPESAEILRLALPLMSKFKIPVTPRNYAVWYEYACGLNLPLKEKIDTHIASGAPITTKFTADLYSEHVDASHEYNQLDSAQKIFSVLYYGLTNVLEKATGNNTEYGRTLDQYNSRMQQVTDLEQLEFLIQDIALSTDTVLKNNSELLGDLDERRSEVSLLQEQLFVAKMQARTDPLTQLSNRKAFFDEIEERFSDGLLTSGDHCLLMLDIDDFKKINDTYGHLFGDKVIKSVAKVLQNSIKAQHLSARFGGEEFIALLSNTDRPASMLVAETIRKTISAASIINPRNNQVVNKLTVSIGIAKVVPNHPIEIAITRADDALYRAKKNGKNQVSFFDQDLPSVV